MVTNTSQIRAIANPGYVVVPSSDEAKKRNGLISNQLDSLSKAQTESKAKSGKLDRPELPPGKSNNADYLSILEVAYAKVYREMSKSVVDQTKDFTKLQTLSQTMSQAVLQSTDLAIKKEKAATQKADDLQKEQAKMAKQDKALNSFMTAVSIGLIIGTIALGFATGGAADAAIPEETAALTLDVAGEEGVEMETLASSEGLEESGGSEAESSAEAETTGSSITSSSDPSQLLEEMEEESQLSEVQEQMTEDLEKSKQANTKSESSWRVKLAKFLAKGLAGGAIAATLSAPQLVTGLQQIELSKKEKSLAKVQEQVGAATALIGSNNAYYQFYQQIIQRKSTVISELAEQLGNVLQTYGDITKAYQQISYGLSAAV